MKSRKTVLMNPFARQQWRRIESRPMDMRQGEEGEGRMYGESNMETSSTVCKIDSQWEFAVWLRELKPGLCNNPEGWDGEGGEREVQDGRIIGILIADSVTPPDSGPHWVQLKGSPAKHGGKIDCWNQPSFPQLEFRGVSMRKHSLPMPLYPQFSSVAQSCLTLQPHGLQHARLPCPSPTPGAYSNSHPLSQWCHPTISPSVVPFSSCPQSFPESFPMSYQSFPMSLYQVAKVLELHLQHQSFQWIFIGPSKYKPIYYSHDQ